MSRLLRELRLALAFLTRLPVGNPGAVEAPQLGRCMAWFPLAGLLVGTLLLAADRVLAVLLPPPAGNVLLLALWVLLSGALHLDGLADLCDGVGGGRDRESMLRIMKDSRIGVFGAVALVLVLLGKWAALTSLAGPLRLSALLFAPLAGRWAPVLLTVTVPYLRGPEGTGSAFAAHAGRRELLLASLALTVAAAVLGGAFGLALAAAVVAATMLYGAWVRRRLGGVTGDVLGAAVELVEVLVLLAAAGAALHPACTSLIVGE